MLKSDIIGYKHPAPLSAISSAEVNSLPRHHTSVIGLHPLCGSHKHYLRGQILLSRSVAGLLKSLSIISAVSKAVLCLEDTIGFFFVVLCP